MTSEKHPLTGTWHDLLNDEFSKPYMRKLRDFLIAEKAQKKVIYPPSSLTFNAFNTTAFEDVKVVILGQDPYHGHINGTPQAHGLCFSVQEGLPPPPSLVNIYKELNSDLGLAIPQTGHLLPWAEQGVFMLNATLSVTAGQAGSHQKMGWEAFTDRAIQLLNEQREHIVFMLWGSYAQKKGEFIDTNKHCVLKAPHPSPLSAHRGFLGCKHFSQANAYLKQHGIDGINWSSNSM